MTFASGILVLLLMSRLFLTRAAGYAGKAQGDNQVASDPELES